MPFSPPFIPSLFSSCPAPCPQESNTKSSNCACSTLVNPTFAQNFHLPLSYRPEPPSPPGGTLWAQTLHAGVEVDFFHESGWWEVKLVEVSRQRISQEALYLVRNSYFGDEHEVRAADVKTADSASSHAAASLHFHSLPCAGTLVGAPAEVEVDSFLSAVADVSQR